jgi:aryl-alcohol dehydrogenase-like predicted oxidoreductase
MRTRRLGSTGVDISEIGFGCGNVGGLMIRGEARERRRAVEHALEHGITYFDTAAQYGDGESERNLGLVLRELEPDVVLGTKINVRRADLDQGLPRIRELLQAGLLRLGRERVDILYYHGRVCLPGSGDQRGLTPEEVLGPLLDSFRVLQRDGLVRFVGITGLGDTDGVLQVLRRGAFDVFHCYFNAVNPSAGFQVPPSFQAQDLGEMITAASSARMGVLAIRVLAAGALAGGAERHPLAGGTGGVLIQGTNYERDVALAERLRPIANELGIDMAQLAIRFVLSRLEVSTALVGFSSLEQIDASVRAAEAGPLPGAVVEHVVRTVVGAEAA